MVALSDQQFQDNIAAVFKGKTQPQRTSLISAAVEAVNRRINHYYAWDRGHTTLHADLLGPHVDVLVTARRKLVNIVTRRYLFEWDIVLWLPGSTGPFEACRVMCRLGQHIQSVRHPAVSEEYIISAFQCVEAPKVF